jgi:hypothetical protein
MPEVELPLSGNVNQVINVAWPFSISGGCCCSCSAPASSTNDPPVIKLGMSAHPVVERELLQEAGSYGRQIGRIADALQVVLKHLQQTPTLLSEDDKKSIHDFKRLLETVADVKERHGLTHIVRPD